MDRNLLLAFALSFAVLMLWTLTQEPQRRPVPAGSETEAQAPESPAGPLVSEPIPEKEAGPLATTPAPTAPEPEPEVRREARTITIENDLYRARFSTLGGGLVHFELLQFQVSRQDSTPVTVTTGVAPYDTALLTPFAELGLGDLSNAIFDVERESNSEIVFAFSRGGVTVRKRYTFDRDSYAFRLAVEFENGSKAALEPRFSLTWPAHKKIDNDFKEQGLLTLHQGKVTREHLAGLGSRSFLSCSGGPPQTVFPYEGPVEWTGVETTYFLAAMLPDDPGKALATVEAVEPGATALAILSFAPVDVPPGHRAERNFKIYVGPKEPGRLEHVGSNLDLAINQGWSWFTPLARFFGWLLHQTYAFVPNYGVAIILLTILVRGVTAPLTVKQMRSMERMRTLQPKVKEIQEKHADDRQKQSEAMMALYRQEKVNPLGGCLPMVIQFPVFIGLYYALRSSIELRQAPFVGWIDDLSAPEALFQLPGIGVPVRVLPLVMGVTMVLQQRIAPMQAGVDPAQQRMMMTVMPIVMTVVFYQFASGLVLYWMVSNVLAILHQLWIRRLMGTGGGSGSKSTSKAAA